MQKFKIFGICLAMLIGTLSSGGTAAAATLTEDFEASPFSTWETRWFGANSNAENFYVTVYGSGNNVPGSVPATVSNDWRGPYTDGLIITTGGAWGSEPNIIFAPSFASSLISFAFDAASYITNGYVQFFDKDNVLISSLLIVPTYGASDPGVYNNYSVTSSNGIGRIRLTNGSSGIFGNIIIDNLVAVDNVPDISAVPIPAALPLLASALGAFGFIGWRRKRKTAEVL